MDADQIRRLKPKLFRYLKRFDDCCSRRNSRDHFSTYIEGQLAGIETALDTHLGELPVLGSGSQGTQGEKSGPHRVPGARRGGGAGAELVA